MVPDKVTRTDETLFDVSTSYNGTSVPDQLYLPMVAVLLRMIPLGRYCAGLTRILIVLVPRGASVIPVQVNVCPLMIGADVIIPLPMPT